MAPHLRQTTWATLGGAPGGLVSISSLLGTPTTSRSAFGIHHRAATSVPRLGAPPLAELLVDAVPVPHLDPVPRSPGWEDNRREPVPHGDRVRARPRAICPTREDRASPRNNHQTSPDERPEQTIRVLLVDDHLSF